MRGKTYQRYRFKLEHSNGEVIEGGAETRELCIDHIRHSLLNSAYVDADNPLVRGWYLGRSDRLLKKPQEIKV
jgi:hypothetical protein